MFLTPQKMRFIFILGPKGESNNNFHGCNNDKTALGEAKRRVEGGAGFGLPYYQYSSFLRPIQTKFPLGHRLYSWRWASGVRVRRSADEIMKSMKLLHCNLSSCIDTKIYWNKQENKEQKHGLWENDKMMVSILIK